MPTFETLLYNVDGPVATITPPTLAAPVRSSVATPAEVYVSLSSVWASTRTTIG